MRHELKFHVNQGDAAALSSILRGTLKPDENADTNGEYHIRSLYFDDVYNTALVDKVSGIRDRDKYRIRIYNFSESVIRLERKRKRGDYIEKDSALITRNLADRFIYGQPEGLERIDHPLIREMYRQMRTNLLKPVVIVDYVREAYVHPAENTRITLDKQLRTGLMSRDLFNPRLPTVPVFLPETVVLEVKYDRKFPAYLPKLLSSIKAQRNAISKYVLCRQYEFSR